MDDSFEALIERAAERAIAQAADAPVLPTKEYLTPDEAAAWLSVARKHLENLRVRGEGARYVKWGQRIVRYHINDLREFMKSLPGREV